MLSLYDNKIKGEEYCYYLVFDFIKVATFEEAIRRQQRLIKHDCSFWEKEDTDIYFIVSKVESVYKDGSYSYVDIKKEIAIQ